jgi:hypothetical protein
MAAIGICGGDVWGRQLSVGCLAWVNVIGLRVCGIHGAAPTRLTPSRTLLTHDSSEISRLDPGYVGTITAGNGSIRFTFFHGYTRFMACTKVVVGGYKAQ